MSDAIDRGAAERRNCIRLRIDKDDTMGVTIWHGTARVWMDGDSLSGEEWASTDLASVVRWLHAQTDQFAAAYRAAKPDSTGAAPHAVPMRLDLEHETILTLQHLKACAGAWEPDARIVGNVRAVEILAACAEVLRRALLESEAAPPAAEPGVTRTRCTIIQTAPTPLQFDPEKPAAEPAPRPRDSFPPFVAKTEDGKVRCQVAILGTRQQCRRDESHDGYGGLVSHHFDAPPAGKVCPVCAPESSSGSTCECPPPAAEPAKPDLPWGTDIGPSDYMTPAADPAIFQKPPGSFDEGAVRGNNPEPAKEPAPCKMCGGRGQVFDRPCVGPFDTKSACPSCRPGGAA